MTKKLILALAFVALLAGCGAEKTENAAEQAVTLTVAEFNANAAQYVDKTVTLTGTVDHVCKHGGKKMFVMGEDPADRLKIEVGESIAAFDIALEGSKVSVTGVGRVLKMDSAYLDTWEAESCSAETQMVDQKVAEGAEKIEETAEQVAEKAEEHIEKQNSGERDRIAQLREQLETTGEDYIGFYHLEAASFEELH